MALVSLNTLYSRFKKGLKPTGQHFRDMFDSFWHKSGRIPSGAIDGLQGLLDTKMDKKAVVTADQVGVYAPAKNYVFDAQKAEYVSFANPSSTVEQFKTEKFYRLKEDAPAGENPETHPAHWAYQGTAIGEITVDDVVGLREELDDIRENGGSGGTSDHGQLTNRNAADAHPLSSITPTAGNAKKLVVVDASGNVLGYSTFDFDQIFQFGDMDVSGWLNGEKRLALISNNNGQAALEDAAALRDIFAPPGVDAQLLDQRGWVNEKKTITGENYRGEIGNAGQMRPLPEGIFECESSAPGDEGGGNGSSTWVRNRAVDVLDPDNSSQDSTICDHLNPMRTGGNTDDGWDLTNNTKVLTVPAKWGTWWKDTGGYMYFCYSVSGTNSYWWRNGTPRAVQAPINSASHPTLTANLLAHDFTSGVYTDQAGDEQSYWDQYFYDSATRSKFEKISSTQWEKIR